jgi:hypothetical protein
MPEGKKLRPRAETHQSAIGATHRDGADKHCCNPFDIALSKSAPAVRENSHEGPHPLRTIGTRAGEGNSSLPPNPMHRAGS